MCADRTEDATFELASDGFTQMLGVPQSNLTVVGRRLQADGLIRYSRSAITVVDRQGLEAATADGRLRVIAALLPPTDSADADPGS
jgi:hypothetical protein